MAKIEKEVKVLDINVDSLKVKLVEMGALYKGEKNQKIFVYDLPSLYYRFLEIVKLINSDNGMIINTSLKKLDVLMLEFTDLIDDKLLFELQTDFKIKDLNMISKLPLKNLKKVLSNNKLNETMKAININPNKWIRLRESNGNVELTTKHILNKKNDKFQNVIETEIDVSSLEETNKLLESIGITKRSYQEKKRYSFEYKDAEIELDIWPLIKPYMEIETDNEKTITEVINMLGLDEHEIVSMNTEQLYKRIGIDIHSMSELKF